MTEQDYLIETMTIELAKLAITEGLASNVQSALDVVYNSETYEKVADARTHLMYQHPGYVYCYLKQELQTGKL